MCHDDLIGIYCSIVEGKTDSNDRICQMSCTKKERCQAYLRLFTLMSGYTAEKSGVIMMHCIIDNKFGRYL